MIGNSKQWILVSMLMVAALFAMAQPDDPRQKHYVRTVRPIIMNNCFSCHSNNNASDFAYGITFEDYEDVAASATLIIGAINHEKGFPEMPKNREKLDPCLIHTFEAWVNQGSFDN